MWIELRYFSLTFCAFYVFYFSEKRATYSWLTGSPDKIQHFPGSFYGRTEFGKGLAKVFALGWEVKATVEQLDAEQQLGRIIRISLLGLGKLRRLLGLRHPSQHVAYSARVSVNIGKRGRNQLGHRNWWGGQRKPLCGVSEDTPDPFQTLFKPFPSVPSLSCPTQMWPLRVIGRSLDILGTVHILETSGRIWPHLSLICCWSGTLPYSL